MVISRWALALSVVSLLALIGCLDFDEQTVYMEHDQENDRLLVIINYRGFYSDKEDVAQARSQLDDAVRDQTVAFFANWPWAFPLREMRDNLADLEAEGTQHLSVEMRHALLGLLDRIRLLNGGFYMDAAGRICGAQVLVIESAAQFVELANNLVNAAILENAEQFESGDPDQMAWGRSLLEFARRGHQWIELDGHSLLVSGPVPEKVLLEGRRELVADLLDWGDEDRDQYWRALCAILGNPVLLWHEDGVLRVRCGYVSVPSEFVTKPRAGACKPNMVDYIAETYGLHLDANLARYLVQPDATADTEAERAARTIAPRLTRPERVRALIHRLKTAPDEPYWARLREENLPMPKEQQAGLANEQLLERWEQWLSARAGPSEKDQGEEAQADG